MWRAGYIIRVCTFIVYCAIKKIAGLHCKRAPLHEQRLQLQGCYKRNESEEDYVTPLGAKYNNKFTFCCFVQALLKKINKRPLQIPWQWSYRHEVYKYKYFKAFSSLEKSVSRKTKVSALNRRKEDRVKHLVGLAFQVDCGNMDCRHQQYIYSKWCTLIEKKRKFSSYTVYRKLRWERLQSHIWGSTYMRRLWLCNRSLLDFLIYEEIFFLSFLSVYGLYWSPIHVGHLFLPNCEYFLSPCLEVRGGKGRPLSLYS